ncbi:MAG: hypothetical protein CVV64_19915 [Candidatus Wallbacteria bacterium HGW-Wallbacteria-1]|jgi:hypothetical protein|uniref:Uncharacterized protein n=1 Tax=Candidatus Wallbacteria bacterium HGW-Wallbacteria-1 TaxID=2013854 RepID=A0A2N1PIK2_9BACT|nr:MAG: hypothetical protein CVV64_19915 [Candidatus Wallbacteria bacterium HGW-Wallbacteria-1]
MKYYSKLIILLTIILTIIGDFGYVKANTVKTENTENTVKTDKKVETELEKVFTADGLAHLAGKSITAVENSLGVKFKVKPEIKIVTVDELIDLRKKLSIQRYSKQYPDISKPTIEAMAEDFSKRIASWLMAEYQPETHTVYLVKDRIFEMLEKSNYISFVKPRIVQMLLIHEFIHAMDEENYEAITQYFLFKTSGERNVYRAVMEGHAQFLTKQIMNDLGDWNLFNDWDQSASKPESSQYFPYHQGLLFFSALSKHGEKYFGDRIFRNPPTTEEEIIFPDKYLSSN